MGLRELVILVLILAIVGVILRGLYVALKARRGQLRMALEKNIPQYDPDELSLSELPNGGARMVERSFAQVVRQNSEFSSRDRLHKGRSEQAIPVLMDTVTDDAEDDVESARTVPSAVAGARQAVRQRHGIKPGAARPPQKPTHRPIDRMGDRMPQPTAQVTAQVTTEPRASVATVTATAAQSALHQSPLQAAPQSEYADPLDSHVFRDDEVDEPRYDAPAFESPTLAAAAAEDDYEDVEQRYEARFDEQEPEDDEDDYDDELENDEDEAESFESVYADDDDYDDELETDDQDDAEVDDPLASRFEDDLDDDEFDDEEFEDREFEDEKFEDKEFDDEESDEDEFENETVEESEEYSYETDFANDRDTNDHETNHQRLNNDSYDDDEEDDLEDHLEGDEQYEQGSEVVEQKTGPRRWLQWAGEKLSGMTAAAASEGERDRERGVEEQARARAEMQERAARAAEKSAGKAESKASSKATSSKVETGGRTERAEPVFGAGSFDDSLLDDEHDHQDMHAFNESPREKLDAQSRAWPAPTARKKLEPLDKSRQSELNLDEPAELRAEPRVESRKAPKDIAKDTAKDTVKAKEQPKETAREQQADADAVPEYSEVLVINVVAKPDREFAGVDLLPVLLTSGLRFGDMSIFHRHIEADTRSPVLFSVANIVNPGTFDLNQINDFATRGLCFFMTLPNVANSMQAFDKMLDVAQQVRIALDGDLKDDNRSVMTAQTIEHYRQRVRDFDLRQLRQHK